MQQPVIWCRRLVADHLVKLSDKEKADWFHDQINRRLQVKSIESEQELIDLTRFLRDTFRKLYGRDVAGSFMRRMLNDLGVAREHSQGVKKKRDWMFNLMDENQSFRDNKTQCRKAVVAYFGESILGIVFDELWNEYHARSDHPDASKNIDIHGQKALFDE